MLIPTGFWSYTSSDEKASRGKLSQLRALLAEELQQQIGRLPVVNIFQDVAAIPPGRDWERQINASLEASSFLIPIVTPAYLQSEWCCYEVAAFREREARLGSTELVFPIHFVDTSRIKGDDAHDCHDAEVAAFLGTRQWTDFRKLRHRSLPSEDVAVLLESLAEAICAALRDADRDPKRRGIDPRPKPTSVVSGRPTAAREAVAPTAATAASVRDARGPTDAIEQFNRGNMYLNGRGVTKDERAAVEWYHKAADQGHANAQFILGFMYANGRGVTKDDRTAVEWYRKAADQGHANAQFNLGFMYANGHGVTKDDRAAVEWYRKAAAQGHSGAEHNLKLLASQNELMS